ncbi:MFS transporter permease [Aliidiomarina haloalkalitolerans]|uniref:MFS transporter permease n=1 Tax=Aliidiomarina haloalkalitolerans TaxID=859059 RepID=A0A432VUP9_9GAMM|nr:MFS transporter permease [Aliidiomarina haloalkalitolerans]RUO20266.1 MFS transporter permease [Aliidiomarina haloalkalitolerans]
MANRQREDNHIAERVYGYLAEDEDARVCKDIPDEACSEQPTAFILHLWSLTLTKLGDSLVSARLVLPWMLSVAGAPAFFISMLVPLRESLSLLPQLFVAQRMREKPVRKWFWVVGSLGQAAALVLIVCGLIMLNSGAFSALAFGWWTIAWLVVFSLARGICSVASKDVLGKTISKTRRGRLTGLAATTAGFMTLATATLILFAPDVEGSLILFIGLFSAAAVLWLLAAISYARIPEVPGATSGGGNAITEALQSLRLLWEDKQFGQFVLTRALLVSSAFSIPYIVVLIQRQTDGVLTGLGGLLLASGLAGMLAGRFWGKWSDSASHQVMAAAAFMASAVMALTLLVNWANAEWLGLSLVGGGLIFLAAVAHHGARVGRKTYLVDMATQENRAQYTAVSNTVIGALLLLGMLLGILDELFGTAMVLVLLIAVGVIAGVRALTLPNVTAD